MPNIILVLLLSVHAPFALAGGDYSVPNLNEDVDLLMADSSELDFRRSKRSLTTICVEIKPSGPQEEPYFMCKGADLEKGSNGGGYGSGYASHKKQQYNSASSVSETGSYQPAVPPATTPDYSTSDTYDGPGSHFQSHSKSYNKKPPASYAQNVTPYSKNGAGSSQQTIPAQYGGFRPQESYGSNAYNGQPETQNGQKQSSAYQHPKAPSFPSYETATTPQYNNKPQTHDQQHQPLPDYESVYAEEQTPPQPPSYTKLATGYGTSSGTSTGNAGHHQQFPSQASYNKPTGGAYHNVNRYQTHGNQNGDYEASSHATAGAHSSEANYGAHNPAKSIHTGSGVGGGAYVYPSAAAAHPTAPAQKSSYAQTVPYAHAAAVPASTAQSASLPASASAAVGNGAYVAPAAGPTKSSSSSATAASSYVRPSSAAPSYGRSMSDGDAAFWRQINNEAALLGAGYQPPTGSYQQSPQVTAENYQDPPIYQHKQTSMPSKPATADRYRSMIDEAVLGPHNWGLSPEELALFRGLPVDEPSLGMPPRLPMELQQQARTMPQPHMDDPLMQQFYSSLHEPPLPAPFSSISPLVGSKNVQPPAKQQIERTYPTYTAPPIQQSSCPTYPSSVASTYAPSPPPPPTLVATPACGSNAHYPSAPPSSSHQYFAASDYGTSYVPTAAPTSPAHNCNSCGHQLSHHSFQPVFIALPCYGQPAPYSAGPSYNTASLPANQPTTYDPTLGMGNPIGKFFGPFGPLASPLHPFGLMNPINGLLSSTQQQAPPSSLSQPAEGDPPMVGSIQSLKAQEKKIEKATELASMTTTTESPVVGAAIESYDESPELFEEKPTSVVDNSEELSSDPENNSETQDSAASEQSGEHDVVVQKVTTPPPLEVVDNSKPKNTKKPDDKIAAVPQQQPTPDMVPKNLEAESKKAYNTMLTAARTFSNISRSETQNSTAEAKPPKGGNPTPPPPRRVEKRQNAKAAARGGNPGHVYKRTYVQKLETDI